jgi:NAD(P)-dependent dehydrogenase (short-subunit alcohol dehydrogenase family)
MRARAVNAARENFLRSRVGKPPNARTDLKRRDDLSDLVKLACERYGKLDVLVNNAGIMPVSPLDDLRVEDWDEMIDINIKDVLYAETAGRSRRRRSTRCDKRGTQRRTSRQFSPAIRRSRSASPPLASSRRSATGTVSRTSSA